MPYKQTIPCGNCKAPRTRGGRKDANNLCWACWIKAGHPKPNLNVKRATTGQPGGKKKPTRDQQPYVERATDKALRYPTSSWWAEVPRSTWQAVVEKQRRDRFQAGGCGVEKSQRPIGAE